MMLGIFFTFSILMMLFLPLLAAALLRRKVSVPWLWFCVGMATFTVSQVIHIPLNNLLGNLGWLRQPSLSGEQPIWQTALILGLTAGLCEELARAAGYLLLRNARSLPNGLMFGLGHGGIESIVFGGILTAASVGSLLPILEQGLDSPQFANLAPEQLLAIQQQINVLLSAPWHGLVPLVERIIAMGLHVTWSVMVLKAFQNRRPGWVLLAIAHHMLVDACAVIASTSLTNVIWIESIIFLTALPGYGWLAWQIRGGMPKIILQPNSFAREARMFWTALKKELKQLLRTRRVLIACAFFGLFGLASPLLAYFLPEMMRLIPGAEAFASLIPSPTTGDAMLQYHKNLTQFAFLLAVFFGMGSVAGEKERGSATLILSKPLPRWAFLVSKLMAQSLLFTFGFTLGAAGGYIYTIILFGSLDLGAFVAMNLVLIAWILPFIALTLVGSVLGSTTTAAGGIGLALVVALMLAGSIPQISGLMPGALASWALQLGVEAAGVPAASPGSLPLPAVPLQANLGALASTLAFILVSLAVSFGFFERQEL